MDLGNSIKKIGKRTALELKRRSPEILMTVGIASLVGSTVLACRATLGAHVVEETYQENLASIERAKEIVVKAKDEGVKMDKGYTELDEKKDRVACQMMRVKDYVKLYGPSVALSILGIVCLLKSRNIMQNRNLALISAYNLVAKGFEVYRNRVKEEFGEDMDRHFRYGTVVEEETVTKTDDEGKKYKEKVLHHIDEKKNVDGSVYSRVFDSHCHNWSNNDDYNLTFLKAKEEYFNFLLLRDGVVFLNDVYDGIGYPKTKAGQVVGWSTKGNGDGVISFGIRKLNYPGSVLGSAGPKAIALDFNVDGIVYDHIGIEI